MSGSEKRLWPLEAGVSWLSLRGGKEGAGAAEAMEVEEEEAEGGHEEKCNSRSHSGPSMYKDWVLPLRRTGCSLLRIRYLKACLAGGAEAAAEAAAWEWTPGGSLTVSGMTGLRRCSGCRAEALEQSEVKEAQLDREEQEPAGVRLGRDARPPGTLGRWTSSGGFGGQTGLHLLR